MAMRGIPSILVAVVTALVLGSAGGLCAADLGGATSQNLTKMGNPSRGGKAVKRAPKARG